MRFLEPGLLMKRRYVDMEEEGALQPRASVFWYNNGGHRTGKGRASLPERSERRLGVPAPKPVWGPEVEACPPPFYRGLTGTFTSGSTFQVSPAATDPWDPGLESDLFQDLNRHLQIELLSLKDKLMDSILDKDPNGGRTTSGCPYLV